MRSGACMLGCHFGRAGRGQWWLGPSNKSTLATSAMAPRQCQQSRNHQCPSCLKWYISFGIGQHVQNCARWDATAVKELVRDDHSFDGDATCSIVKFSAMRKTPRFVQVGVIKCSMGQVKMSGGWSIVDHSLEWACMIFIPDNVEDDGHEY